MIFDETLSRNLKRAIDELGYVEATPIQKAAIPLIREGLDIIGQAQTGTGKTAAFSIPILEMMDPLVHQPQALILSPTRELAVQIAGEVEKLSGMKLLDYLREKLFNKIGTFKTAQILETPNGDSWGDSALVCTPRDMISCARLVMNYGKWEGEQLMSEEYLRAATSCQVDNTDTGFTDVLAHGYGYQIWRMEENSFGFIGMGDQLTICVPDKDLIFVITSDNQGYEVARRFIISGFFDMIVRPASDKPLTADPAAEKLLADATADLRLRSIEGEKDSPFRAELDGVEYICDENKTGITKFRFDFTENGGYFRYTNAQGDKEIPFGMCENVFAKFPQLGYSDGTGGVRTTNGFMYDGAYSAAWRSEKRLMLRIRIIDRYFANATFTFTFKGDECAVIMVKTAEDFLNEYQGQFMARRG